MAENRPDLARLARLCAAAAIAALLPLRAQAGDMSLHKLPLQDLSPSGQERTLDWRGWSAKASFTLPAGLEAQNLRVVLDATPAEDAPAPHAWIEVRLNGSEPAVLRPEPYPFSAQVDFPAQYLRSGRNEAEIRFVSPEGDCPNPSDGAWILDLAASQLELTAPAFQPDSLGALDALLRSEFLSPRTIAIAAPDLDADQQAAFQVWAALATGIRAPETPRFLDGAAEADLRIAFVPDETADAAWLKFIPGDSPAVEVRAPSMDAALALLRDYAASGAHYAGFTIPAFDTSWAPETVESEFYLADRPSVLPMRAVLAKHPDVASAAIRVSLNGHVLPDISFGADASRTIFLPPGLLRPGVNRVQLTPDLTPVPTAALCPGAGAAPPARLTALRLHPGPVVSPDGLFGFAAGELPPGTHLLIPAGASGDRGAQLRLLVEIARTSGRVPDFAAITTAASPPAASTMIVAPRALIDPELLDAAPVSLHAVLRGERPPALRLGSRAIADTLIVPTVAGAAAIFAPPSDPEASVVLVTAAGGADFATTLDHLVASGMLAGFDGRVVRWTRDEIEVQDRGPWQAAPLRLLPPVARTELERTALFLAVIGGLSLSWVMVRARRRRRFT